MHDYPVHNNINKDEANTTFECGPIISISMGPWYMCDEGQTEQGECSGTNLETDL